MSLRHVSLSTCGLADKMLALAELHYQLTLSVSLHAPNNQIRNQLMPINIRFPLEQLLSACDDYFKATGRRICYEYALIKGVNDSEANAKELASRLSGKTALVNLIPYNSVEGTGFQGTTNETQQRFKSILEQHGINTTIRRTLGSDLNASCGQLRRQQS